MNSRCTDRAKDVMVYQAAARVMERGEMRFACFALEAIVYPDHHYCQRMKGVFAPDSERSAWLADRDTDDPEHRRNVRILALCFMAAMVEAGDA